MRTAFIQTLFQLAQENEMIFFVVGDIGFSVVEPFAERYPERFINAGVAEQNMVGMAAGLASEGYHVFIYSIANFVTLRCIEQIRNDVAYHNLPVTIVAVGGGLAYGNLGYSHHAVQDYAMMRAIPNIKVIAPGDPLETQASLKWIAAHPGPSYLRLGKAIEPKIHTIMPKVQPGHLLIIKESTRDKHLVLTTGATLRYGVEFVQQSGFEHWGLASLPIWGDMYRDSLAEQLGHYRKIITVEDHLLSGGFGSYVSETLIQKKTEGVELRSMALMSCVCGKVMRQSALEAVGGLTLEVFKDVATPD